jgi:putative DNA methylase
MKNNTRLIEQIFPVDAISESCKREKSIRQGHISTLQTWWARRPLAVCRSTIFLALLPSIETLKKNKSVKKILTDLYPDTTDFEKAMLKFVAEMSDFDNSNNKDLIGKARKIIQLTNKNPSLADTFSGGGSIPLEALRLGLKTYASDLNPIATTGLALALKFAPGISDEAFKRLQEDIDSIAGAVASMMDKEYDEPEALAYFWARTYTCPTCSHKTPLIQNKWLSKNGTKRAVVISANRKTGNLIFSIIEPKTDAELSDADAGTVSGKSAVCVFCFSTTATDEIQRQGMAGELGEMQYAKYLRREDGKEYIACKVNVATDCSAAEERDTSTINILDLNLPLDLNGVRHLWAIQYGIKTVSDLFNNRQRKSIEIIASTILNHRGEIFSTSESKEEENFRYLALLMVLNKVAIYSNRHSWWQSNGAFPANIFVRQAISMVWNYVEIPPASSGAGGWRSSSKWIVKALEHIRQVEGRASVDQADAAKTSIGDAELDLVVIDPPYFDSITYAYLSDFFYPWNKALLQQDFPTWFEGDVTPKREELIVDRKHKLAPSPKSGTFFSEKMTSCLIEARRTLAPDGLIVLMYGHKDITAWLALFQAIRNAELRVTVSWPIHTERRSKFQHSRVDALGVSCVLVLRPTKTTSDGLPSVSTDDFKSLVLRRMKELKQKHPELEGDPVALSMSIFPLVLDDYMHMAVVDSDGNPLSIAGLLELVNL